MRNRTLHGATVFALLLSWIGALAQPVHDVVFGPAQTADEQLRWTTYRRFSRHEGLPRNWVAALANDRDGFIYAGTEGGLARYDGQRWQSLLFPVDAPVRQPYVSALAAAQDGSVWVGTDNAGLYIYRNDKLEPRRLPGANAVAALRADPDRGVWVGTPQGLFLCGNEDCRAIDAARGIKIKSLLPAQDAAGAHLYVGASDAGVYRIDDPYGSPRLADWRLTRGDGLPDDSVGALIQWGGRDKQDVWIGTAQGVARLGSSGIVVYTRSSGFPDGVTGFLAVPQSDGSERLLATMVSNAIAEFGENGSWRWTTTANGLPENPINTAMLTNSGQATPVVWLGTAHNGVLRAEPQMWSAFGTREGLPNRFVSALGQARFLDDKDTVWIGTSEGSVRWDHQSWRPWLPPKYARSEVFEVIRDADQLWVATRGGLLLLSSDGVREYTAANSALPDDGVVGMHLQTTGEGAGTLWLGTHRGVATVRNQRLASVAPPAGLAEFFVRVLRSTAAGDGATIIWAGAEQGLFYRRAGAWHAPACAGIDDNAVFDLRERGTAGHEHVLWVAAFDGLLRIDLDHDLACTALDLPAPVHAASIYQLQFDSRGRMYLFSAYGVVRLTADTHAPGGYTVEQFGLADGLPDLEFARASLVDARGRIWGGSLEGAAMYDPAAETLPTAPSPLRILAVTEEQSGRALREGTDLDTAESNVAFDLSLLAYQRDHRTRYRSQLLGLDAQPGEWLESARRSYSRLPPANYEFRAWARDANGIEAGPVVWRFQVHAPWWRRIWALCMYTFALVLLGVGAGRLRVHALARRARVLQQQVTERTQELAKANRQLERAALTDPLTGLWNRRYFSLELLPECERAIRRVGEHAQAADLIFVLIDVDHFKHINDQHGHSAGDAVLIEFAQRIRALLRSSDIAVRWGGEEFLVALRDARREQAGALALRLQTSIAAAPFQIEGADITVTCCAGWAAFPFIPEAPRSHSVDQVIALADAALYRAKLGGRNREVGAVTRAASATDGAPFEFVDALADDAPATLQTSSMATTVTGRKGK